MQVRKVLGSLWRRWYIVVLGGILTAGACFFLQSSTPDTYKAQASLVLLPSAQSVGEGGNPYLGLGGMSEALDILARKMSSEEFKEHIRMVAGTDTYTAAPDRGTSGAILLVTASSQNPAAAMKILGAVIDEVPVTLNELQDVLSVPPASRISTMKLLVDRTPSPEVKARTQVLLVSAAGGTALTLVMTVLLDGLLLSRKARRVAREQLTDPAQDARIEAAPHSVAAELNETPLILSRPLGIRPKPGEPARLSGETTEVVPSSHRPG